MDIEALAKKAGMITELRSGAASCVWTAGLTAVSADQLIAFAELVAAEEREACAKVCDRHAAATWNDDRKTQARLDATEIRERSNAKAQGRPE